MRQDKDLIQRAGRAEVEIEPPIRGVGYYVKAFISGLPAASGH
jgi:hypothetical protein